MNPRKPSKKGLAKNSPDGLSQQRLDFSAVIASSPMMADTPISYTVSEITELLAATLEESPVLGGSLIVQGELSNVKQSARGHVYFTLKDEGASINGILWASTAARLNFDLEDGLEVFLTGRLEIYKPHGTYSIVGSKIEPVGMGALQLAFEQTKARLEAEGLFMEEFKKPIPDFPTRIGIVTSSTGAVIHDMLRVIRRKNPLVDVLLAPVKVQGEGAALEIASAIDELNQPQYDLDVIIVGRGGGSFEDLFCFSEEPVVRAIFRSTVPIITGIGHEPDYALADAAADYSASTPTAAADWAVPDIEAIVESLAEQARELFKEMRELLLIHEQALDYQSTRMIESHTHTLEAMESKVTRNRERLLTELQHYFQKQDHCFQQHATELNALSPLATIDRGYAIPIRQDGTSIRSAVQAVPGERIRVRLSDGELDCDVVGIRPSRSLSGQPPSETA